MSLWCECKDCGGNDELAMCENALLQAHIAVAKANQSYLRILFSEHYFLFVTLTCAMAIAGLAGSMHYSSTAPYPPAREPVMSDQF